jgi:hypothetical protein
MCSPMQPRPIPVAPPPEHFPIFTLQIWRSNVCRIADGCCGCALAGVQFADPGKERQDSVFSGFSKIPEDSTLVCAPQLPPEI